MQFIELLYVQCNLFKYLEENLRGPFTSLISTVQWNFIQRPPRNKTYLVIKTSYSQTDFLVLLYTSISTRQWDHPTIMTNFLQPQRWSYYGGFTLNVSCSSYIESSSNILPYRSTFNQFSFELLQFMFCMFQQIPFPTWLHIISLVFFSLGFYVNFDNRVCM